MRVRTVDAPRRRAFARTDSGSAVLLVTRPRVFALFIIVHPVSVGSRVTVMQSEKDVAGGTRTHPRFTNRDEPPSAALRR